MWEPISISLNIMDLLNSKKNNHLIYSAKVETYSAKKVITDMNETSVEFNLSLSFKIEQGSIQTLYLATMNKDFSFNINRYSFDSLRKEVNLKISNLTRSRGDFYPPSLQIINHYYLVLVDFQNNVFGDYFYTHNNYFKSGNPKVDITLEDNTKITSKMVPHYTPILNKINCKYVHHYDLITSDFKNDIDRLSNTLGYINVNKINNNIYNLKNYIKENY